MSAVSCLFQTQIFFTPLTRRSPQRQSKMAPA